MDLNLLIRICNFHVFFELIFGYIYVYSIDLENSGMESTLFWIITTLPILLYCSSVFICFMLSNTTHKFHNIIDVVYPPLIALVSYLLGDFEYYVNKMKINEIPKNTVVSITWMINSVCEFFIDVPKAYIFIICERVLQEKADVYNANKFLIEITKYLAFVGAIKGLIAVLFAFYSFITFMLNDNADLTMKKEKSSKKESTAKKKDQ